MACTHWQPPMPATTRSRRCSPCARIPPPASPSPSAVSRRALKNHLTLLAAIAVLACGCATNATRDVLTPTVAGAADEDRLVVVAVENDDFAAGPPRPASTRPGY